MSDVLSEVLRSMRIQGTVYFCDQVTAPWTKEFVSTTTASFHQIRRGGCWLVTDTGTDTDTGTEKEPVYLASGDVVFLEAGLDHTLRSHLPDQPVSGVEPDTLLMCGYLDFAHDVDTPIKSLFPRLSILREEDIQASPWLKTTLDQLAVEFLSLAPGVQLVVDRLTEILVVELIRTNFGAGGDTQYIRAMNDRIVGSALQRLHARPEYPWTLQTMASEVGVSRAGLANRFKDLVGTPMFEYLTGLRMQRAKELLSDGLKPIIDVANQVGYESDISFVKAFKKRIGLTPAAYRKQLRT